MRTLSHQKRLRQALAALFQGHISSIERATALAITSANDGWGSCVVSLRMFHIIVVVKKSSLCSIVWTVEATVSDVVVLSIVTWRFINAHVASETERGRVEKLA